MESDRLKDRNDIRFQEGQGELISQFVVDFFLSTRGGKFSLSEEGWEIAGDVDTFESKKALLKTAEEVTGPGYALRDQLRVMSQEKASFAVLCEPGDRVVIEGSFPVDQADALRDAVAKALPRAEVDASQLMAADQVTFPAAEELLAFLGPLFRGVGEGSLRFQGGKLILKRPVFDPSQREELLALAGNVVPKNLLIDQMVLTKQEEFLMVADWTSEGWKLGGTLPAGDLSKELRSTFAPIRGFGPGNLTAEENTEVEAPAWTGNVAAFLEKAQDELEVGRIELRSDGMVLSGLHRREVGKERLLAVAKASFGVAFQIEDNTRLPAGAMAMVPEKPASLGIEFLPERVLLTGEMPPGDVIEGLLQSVAKAAGQKEVENQLRYDPAVIPPAWATSIERFLPDFSARTFGGEVAIQG
ncbi:MAG: hypothetical protein AAGJ31_16060, partial [Verrucomicrobiota bacterium]